MFYCRLPRFIHHMCIYILNKIQRFIYDEGQTMKVIANVLNSLQEIQSLAFDRLTLRSDQNCFLNYKSKSCNRFFVGHKTLALATNCILNVQCRYTVAPINRFHSHFIRCLYLIMYIADAGAVHQRIIYFVFEWLVGRYVCTAHWYSQFCQSECWIVWWGVWCESSAIK